MISHKLKVPVRIELMLRSAEEEKMGEKKFSIPIRMNVDWVIESTIEKIIGMINKKENRNTKEIKALVDSYCDFKLMKVAGIKRFPPSIEDLKEDEIEYEILEDGTPEEEK